MKSKLVTSDTKPLFFVNKDWVQARIVASGLHKIFTTIEELDFSDLNDDDFHSFKMLATDSENVTLYFLNLLLDEYPNEKKLFALNNFVKAFNLGRPKSAPELTFLKNISAEENILKIKRVLSGALREIGSQCQLRADKILTSHL